METSQTPFGLPRAAHPDLSPALPARVDLSGTVSGASRSEDTIAEVVATGPFKVYSPDATDWTVGIDLRVDGTGLAFTTPAGQHRFTAEVLEANSVKTDCLTANRFTLEMSPDGRIVWVLGNQVDHPAVTVLMPATADDLRTRMPGVEFADLDEAAHILHRLTAATAAGRHTRHRFGLQRPGDLGLAVDPLDGEPVLALLRLTDDGMEFRGGGRWEKDSPAERIAPFTALVPVTRGAVSRFDHLERSPTMSLSLFRRFVIPGSLASAASPQSLGPQSQDPQSADPELSSAHPSDPQPPSQLPPAQQPDGPSGPSAPAPVRPGAASSLPPACTAPERAPASAESTTSVLR